MFINSRLLGLSALAVGTAVLLAGCGAGPTAQDPAPAGTTRTVTDAHGQVTIPAHPKKVLALDEYAATSMATIGVQPDLTYLVFSDPLSPQVFGALGMTTRPEPDFLSQPSFETIARDAPDLIVTSDAGPLAAQVAKLSEIAPTVSLSFGQGWQVSTEQTAAIFGTDPAPVVTALRAKIDALTPRVHGTSVAMLLDYGTGPNYPEPTSPMAALLKETGFARPAAEEKAGASGGEFIVPISPERIVDHDADLIAIFDTASYKADLVRGQKLFGSLKGRSSAVDGTAWFGNSSFSMWWVLDDLSSMLDGAPTHTAKDAPDVWKAYAAAALPRT